MIDISASAHHVGDCRELLARLPDVCVQTCITSPPYWGLRNYGHAGQLGLEATPELYVAAMVDVFRGVRRVLRDDGTLWLNLGDSYASAAGGYDDKGSVGATSMAVSRSTRAAVVAHRRRKPPSGLKPKDLVGIPWMVAFALRSDGWFLRSEIIWHKQNPMPESVRDRPTKAHEQIFLLSKSESYYYDADAIAEPLQRPGDAEYARRSKPIVDSHIVGSGRNDHGRSRGRGFAHNRKTRNKRSVWTVASAPFSGAHFACFPPRLIEPCVLAGSRPGELVLDPFHGSGTTGMVAQQHGRRWTGFDLGYADLAAERMRKPMLPMRGVR